MTAIPPTTPTTAVATTAPEKKLSPAAAEAQALRKMTVEIRGQQWGASCSAEVQWAVARYCLRNGLDAVRHVEVLGGRIYLTAEFYREQGAELLLDGTIVPEEPQFVHADSRLDLLADGPDADMATYAKAERARRIRARIQYGIDEESPAAAVVRFHLKSGAVIVGVNWIQGPGGKKRDPVGQSEPTKTAVTRAERRAWRQVVEAIPTFREKVGPIEAGAKIATAEVAEIITTEVKQVASPHPAALNAGGGQYTGSAVQSADLAPIDEAERLAALDAEAKQDRDARTAADEAFEMELDK